MTPEQCAFFAALVPLAALHVAAMVIAHRDHLRRLRDTLRARARGPRRGRRVTVRAPPASRPIGFLSHLLTRESEPPPSAFVHVLPPREVVVHRPTRTETGREVMRPRARTRG